MDNSRNMVEQILNQIKNNRIIAVIVVIGTIMTALVAFTDTLHKAWQAMPWHNADSCSGDSSAHIVITKPRDNEEVTSLVDVSGTSTIHGNCQNIFVIIRSTSIPVWKIVDMTQVNTDGQWASMAKIDEIPPNIGVTIEARLTDKSTAYSVNQCLTTPPDKGSRSNIVRVKRTQ